MADAPEAYAKPNFDPMDVVALAELIANENEDVTAKVKAFEATFKDWEAFGDLETEQDAEDLAEFLAGVGKWWTIADTRRTARKVPYDNLADTVQQAFKDMALVTLANMKTTLAPVMKKWLLAKKAADAVEAQRLAAEAQAKIAAAVTKEDVKDANKIASAAKKLAKGAGVSTIYGASAGLSTKWKYEVTDITLVPAAYLLVDNELINKTISGGKVKEIPGLRIYEDSNTVSRS